LPGDYLLSRSPFFGGVAGSSAGSSAFGFKGGPSDTDLPRVFPKHTVFGFTEADEIVSEIHIEDTIGTELPTARVVLSNIDKRFNYTSLAKEQTLFPVSLGYTNPGTEVFGPFIVQRPKSRFMAGTAPNQIEIVGYGEAVKLGMSERREIYKKMRDSDIAGKIAYRHGFGVDAEATDQVHDQVIQANESDYKFLCRRAKMYGYLVYVAKSVLHFHRLRPRDSGYRLTWAEDPATAGPEFLDDFIVRSRTFMRGLKLRLNQIDPMTKEEIDLTSSEAEDPVQGALIFNNWKELVTIPGEKQPERFITNEGHEQQRPLLQTQLDRMAQSTRYIISGWGHTCGLERLRANDIVTLDGIGRNSGKYFITKVSHDLDDKGYRNRFEAVRCGSQEVKEVMDEYYPSQESVVRA
jgi:phage protein D